MNNVKIEVDLFLNCANILNQVYKAGENNLNRENFFVGSSELQQFIESMPGGFFVYRADDEEKIIYANKITLEIFGCEDFEDFLQVVGGSFKGLVHPDDYKRIENSIDKQVAESNRKLDYVEYRIIRKDGAIRYIDDYGRLVNTQEYGNVYYVFIRDITEIFEERRENARRAKVIEGLSGEFSSIFLFNLEKDLIKPYHLQENFPKQLAEEFNLNSTGFISRWKMFQTFAERYFFPDDRASFLLESSSRRIVERIQNEPSYRMTYRILGENKNLRYVEMSVISIEENKYAVVAFRDVSEIFKNVYHE